MSPLSSLWSSPSSQFSLRLSSSNSSEWYSPYSLFHWKTPSLKELDSRRKIRLSYSYQIKKRGKKRERKGKLGGREGGERESRREKGKNNHRTQVRKEKERGEEKKSWLKNKLVKKTNSFLSKAPSIDNFFFRDQFCFLLSYIKIAYN